MIQRRWKARCRDQAGARHVRGSGPWARLTADAKEQRSQSFLSLFSASSAPLPPIRLSRVWKIGVRSCLDSERMCVAPHRLGSRTNKDEAGFGTTRKDLPYPSASRSGRAQRAQLALGAEIAVRLRDQGGAGATLVAVHAKHADGPLGRGAAWCTHGAAGFPARNSRAGTGTQ